MSKDLPVTEKYQIEKKIKEGSFGSTYFAISKENQKRVIIKHISLKKADAVNRITYIEHEAKIIANLEHPQIPKYVDFYTVETEKNVDIYFIQEYIRGSNLYQLVQEKKFFSEEDVINIAIGICHVLKYIHSFSPPIIHQDIKPANIIQAYDNTVFLIDFGAVKQKILYDRFSEMGISTIIGTHGYMPIEQFEGRAVPGSDIYSLGLSLIFLLSHKEPLQLDKKGLNFDFRKSVKISDEFARIIEKMTVPDWRNRYSTASELEKDLTLLEGLKNNKKKGKNRKIYETIKTEIREDERIRWFGKPKPLNIIKKHLKNLILKYSLISLILIPFLRLNGILPKLTPLVFWGFIFAGIFTGFFISYLNSQRLTYIITNLRAIIIYNGLYKTVKTFNNSGIIDIIVNNSGKKTGDLNFFRKNSSENFSFEAIDNVMLVHQIAAETIIEKGKND